jgi:hypothetical protein
MDKKLLVYAGIILCFIGISIYTGGCADEPSSLGLNFIPPGDTESVKVFDTRVDSMFIKSTYHKKLTNTSGSINLMVGKKGSYDSKALLQFYNIDSGYGGATVNSASLILKYRNYYFPGSQSDSLGQVGFDVFKIREELNFGRITLDSVDNNTFGTISQGVYTGTPSSDSEEVSISLNTTMVKDWLELANDSNYSVKNYGIVLSPGSSSNVIKGFYSAASNNNDLKPELYIILTKNNNVDTLRYDATASLSLANNPSISQTNELFFLQAGIAYIQILKFDMTRIPSTATINDVQLYLTLDPANSILANKTESRIRASRVTDTAGLVVEEFNYESTVPTGDIYTFRVMSTFVVSPFQRWLSGETNYGLYLYPTTIQTNLDLFAIYNTTAADSTKRPRLVIKYTPR